MSNLPFNEIILEENMKCTRTLREFSSNLDSEDLYWHKDKEDREVKVINGTGWYLQLENSLPVLMLKDQKFRIPRNTWHRVINKDNNDLIIEVIKYK